MAERIAHRFHRPRGREGMSVNLQAILQAAEEHHARTHEEIKESRLASLYRKTLLKITPVAALPLTAMLLVGSHAQSLKMTLPMIAGNIAGGVVGERVITRLRNAGKKWNITAPTAFFAFVLAFYAAGIATSAGYDLWEHLSKPPQSPPTDILPPDANQSEPVKAKPEPLPRIEGEYPQTLAPDEAPERPSVPETAGDQVASVPPTVLEGNASVWSELVRKIPAEAGLDADGRQSFAHAFHSVAREQAFQNELLNRTGASIPWTAIQGPVYFDRLFSDPDFISRLTQTLLRKYPSIVREIPPSMEVREWVEMVAKGFTRS